MSRPRHTALLAAVFLLGILPASADQHGNHDDGNDAALFKNIVVVGDSLSAGFQNFSLYDSDIPGGAPLGGQQQGYAALVAKQAGASMAQPLISYPGIPPALILDGSKLTRAPGFGTRVNFGQQTYNLSVPGFTLADALAHPYNNFASTNVVDILSDMILGPGTVQGCGPLPANVLPPMNPPSTSGLGVSEVICAAALKPSLILVSLGNNDALQALTLGIPPTDVTTFARNYARLFIALRSTGAKIVVSNIPDVTTIPFLMPVPVFKSVCPVADPPVPAWYGYGDFVVPDITKTSLDLCKNYAMRPRSVIESAKNAVTNYNLIIAAAARLTNSALVDVNGLVNRIARDGYKIRNRILTTGPLGGMFSLDGVHPSNTGYAIMANEVIKTMNSEFDTNVSQVNVEQVAKADPLIIPQL